MQIPLSEAIVPEWMLVKCLLPEGYSATKEGDRYAVTTSCYVVAHAFVDNGFVEFEFFSTERGEEFRQVLCATYPKYDPSRPVWMIYYRWRGAYTFVGGGFGFTTPNDALAQVNGYHLDNGAMLCSIKHTDLFRDDFNTLTAQEIGRDGETLLPDSGPKRIIITHLERFIE